MPFITPNQVKTIRFSGARDYTIKELNDKKVKLVMMSARRALQASEFEGAARMQHVFSSAIIDLETQDLITFEEAGLLLEVLSIQGITEMMNMITSMMPESVKLKLKLTDGETLPDETPAKKD